MVLVKGSKPHWYPQKPTNPFVSIVKTKNHSFYKPIYSICCLLSNAARMYIFSQLVEKLFEIYFKNFKNKFNIFGSLELHMFMYVFIHSMLYVYKLWPFFPSGHFPQFYWIYAHKAAMVLVFYRFPLPLFLKLKVVFDQPYKLDDHYKYIHFLRHCWFCWLWLSLHLILLLFLDWWMHLLTCLWGFMWFYMFWLLTWGWVKLLTLTFT